jgi:hypothetical protein
MAFGYNEVEVPLNNAVKAAAAKHGWNLVSGIAAAFLDHGITANPADRWVNTDEESRVSEGPVDSSGSAAAAGAALGAKFGISIAGLPGGVLGGIAGFFAGNDIVERLDRMETQGIAHPNDKGQVAIERILMNSLSPFLRKEANWKVADPAGSFAVTQVGSAVTLTPRWISGSVAITVTQAPDVPNDFQVWVGSGLAYEAPGQHQQLTISHGLMDYNDSFSVKNLASGITVTLEAGSGWGQLGTAVVPALDTFTVDGTGSPVTILASAGPAITYVNIERTAADTTVKAGGGGWWSSTSAPRLIP